MAYSFSELEGLWEQAGGSAALAPIMAAIALAESGGNPNATGGVGERGLWQINPGAWGNLATYDPLGNAKAAVYVLAHQGLTAWSTYTSGAYKQYLSSAAPSGVSTTSAVSAGADPFSIIDGIGKTIGNLISGPVSIAEGVSSIAHDFGVLSGTLNTIFNDALWLFKPSSWVRIIAFGFGVGALLPGVWMLSKAGKGEGDISLALGILLVVLAGVLFFIAFHSLGDNVRSIGDLLKYISDEIRGNSPATITPLQDQNIASAAVGVGQRQAATGNQAGA